MTAVRRSALEAAHAAAGARWHSDDVRWPVGYGEEDGAAGTGPTEAGLAETGPLDELLLRGPAAAAAAARLTGGRGWEDGPRLVPVDLGGDGAAWFLAPDEVLLVAPVGDWVGTVAADLVADDVSAIEMTGARTTLRLVGPGAPAILAELCAADTHPRTMPEGSIVQAPMVGARAFIGQQDAAGGPGYTIMVARDEATYIWDAIRHVGAAHGLALVGPAAVAPASQAAPAAAAAARGVAT